MESKLSQEVADEIIRKVHKVIAQRDWTEFVEYISSFVDEPKTIVIECANFDCPECKQDTYWESIGHKCHHCPACGCFTEYTKLSEEWNEYGLWGRKCNNCEWREE